MVSEARCDVDRDDNCANKSKTMKLLGNATCCTTLTNKEKHEDALYVHGYGTSKLVTGLRFQKVTEIDDGVFEVDMTKKKIL